MKILAVHNTYTQPGGEDVVFELTVCAALGQASRQLSIALAALDEAATNPDIRRDDGAAQ